MTNEAQSAKANRGPIKLIDEEADQQEVATETSPLVGAGEGSDGAEDNESGKIQESWIGYEDFVGLPWWRIPSVRRTYMKLDGT